MSTQPKSERLIDQGHPSMIRKSIIVSPDCRRLAYVARVGKKYVVVIDGKEERQYDRIEGESLTFSPDSQRAAYVARDAKKRFVVVDGREEKRYKGIVKGSLLFSTDSQQLGYVADEGVVRHMRHLVVDGQEKDQCQDTTIRSPDLRRVAYHDTAHNVGPDTPIQPGRVVVDKKAGKWYEEGEQLRALIFSPDGKRVAYAINGGEKYLVVVDGQEEKQYDTIEGESLVFSPDSKRVGYVARAGEERFVVVDGQEGEQYDKTSLFSLVFSPDSKRLAYIARVDKRKKGLLWSKKVGESHMVVVDGEEGSQYDSIVAPKGGGGIVFDSPDQLHYLAQKDNAFYLVEERIA